MASKADQNVDTGMPIGVDESPGKVQRRWGYHDPLAGAKGKDPDVSTPSAAYLCMAPRWNRIDTLLAGTEAMRDAGELYLPKHQYETDDNYKERLAKATLKNYTLRTLETLTGKAFKSPPRLNDDVPQQLQDLAEDIDQEGTDFVVFAREWFRSAMAKAFSFVLVDHSRTERVDGQSRTLADDEREGVRPFWRHIEPEDVIHARMEKINNKWQFTQVRIKEFELVPDGPWAERMACRIRVLERGSFQLWELQRQKGRKEKWVMIDDGPMGLDYIPLICYYTAHEGLCEGKPVLEDLAFLNIEHWQSSSDQQNILTVARFPMLAVSGATANDGDSPVVIGPKKWLSVADPQGRIYYVEHAGKAIEAGAASLESLEDQMASYGAEFLRKRPGTSSATGRALDSAEAISPLQAMAIDFKDALELALQYTADWLKLGEGKGGTVVYEVKSDISVGDGKELDVLDSARARRDISRVTLLTELKRRDILSEEFDADKDLEAIEKEPPGPGGGLDGLFPSSGSGAPPKDPNAPDPDATIPGKTGPDKTALK
jgi:hypothetical protein